MNNDLMNQLTCKQFFKAAILLFFAVGVYVYTMIFGKMSNNNTILSLFLMLLFAFVYVIILYIVLSRFDFSWSDKLDEPGERVKKGIIYLIYEVRIAIRLVILIYAFARVCQVMMLSKHSDTAIVIPLIIVMLYLGGKGLRGYICFIEAIFWSVAIALLFILVLCFDNASFAEMYSYMRISVEGSASKTIMDTITKGYMLMLSFSMMEFIMLIYLRVKNRRRGMLVSSVGTGMILSLIASICVISVLGRMSIYRGTKNILNIVGTFQFPGGSMARIGVLVCFVFMVFGIAAILIHFVAAFDVFRGFIPDGRKLVVLKCIWAVIILILYFLARRLLAVSNSYELIVRYLALVDIPLSIVIPALMSVRRYNLKKTGVVVLLLFSMINMSGCEYKSIEDVDYATVLIINKNHNNKMDNYGYTFVINTLNSEDSDSITKEIIWSCDSTSFEDVYKSYNRMHNKTLDLSHVEYVVVSNEEELCNVYSKLINEFTTKYVNVVYEDNILEKAMGQDIKDYLDAHYKGICLSSIDIDKGY